MKRITIKTRRATDCNPLQVPIGIMYSRKTGIIIECRASEEAKDISIAKTIHSLWKEKYLSKAETKRKEIIKELKKTRLAKEILNLAYSEELEREKYEPETVKR